MTTGERIRARRLELGLTQRAMSERCGIAEPTLRRYESGKLNPKLSTCQKIATALEVPVVYLLDASSETKKLAEDVDQMIKSLHEKIQDAQENPNLESLVNGIQPLLAYVEQVQKETMERAFQEDALNKLLQNASDTQIIPNIAVRSPKTSRLITAFDKLNGEGQAKVVELVEDFSRIPNYRKSDG